MASSECAVFSERQRRAREAAESGRRAEEEARRAKEDVVFREVMGIHNGTVDSYLEHCVAEVCSSVVLCSKDDELI